MSTYRVEWRYRGAECVATVAVPEADWIAATPSDEREEARSWEVITRAMVSVYGQGHGLAWQATAGLDRGDRVHRSGVMTAAEAGSRLWDVAMATGHSDALGALDEASTTRLKAARRAALAYGLTQRHVDHATVLGLEWGRDNARNGQEGP